MTECIVVSSDHAGFGLKEAIKRFLMELGYQVEDLGTYSTEPVDYPEYAWRAAEKVASGECSRGIIFCGTGQGSAMVANKVPGVRAALCWDTFSAQLSRSHNDANMLVLAGWMLGQRLAQEVVRVWLATPFAGDRHQRRLEQLRAIETRAYLHPRKVYDVSLTIYPGMLIWPGNSPVEVETVEVKGPGVFGIISRLRLSSHTGTHIDAPSHMILGAPGMDSIGPEVLLGLARLFQLPQVHHIDRKVLEALDLKGITRLLLGTRNSALLKQTQLNPDYAFVSEDAARYLVNIGMKLVGVDYLSIDEYRKKGSPAHHILLGAGVTIVEGLNLDGVPPGDYELLCLPLKLKNTDGAPVRVFLREI